MGATAITTPPGRYWVIGGKHLDAALQQRRWSEVFGPYAAREEAQAMQQRIDAIYRADPQVRFCIVQDAEPAEEI